MSSFVRVLTLCVLILAVAPQFASAASIALRPGASWTERAAASDLQRVIYVATGKLLPVGSLDARQGEVICVGFSPSGHKVDLSSTRLGDQGFVLKTIRSGKQVRLVAAGATPVATSYACFTLAERFGAGFYLGGDALPAKNTPFVLPKLDVVKKPALAVRGVLPWYNFFDSPTAWNIEDYRFFIDQLAKGKNNFLGFHSYDHEPFCAYKGTDGGFRAGAPLHSTNAPTWGTVSMKTSEFAFGTDRYFAKDYFGADCSMGHRTSNEGIASAQKLLVDALWYAKARGVRTCLGFEVSGDPTAPGELDALETRLRNVLKTYPMLDYIWIWEPEALGLWGSATHPSRSDFGAYYRRWEQHFADIEDPRRKSEAVRMAIYATVAHRIIRREAPHVRMVLSAWGGDNHLHFTDFYPSYDRILPKDIIFAALDDIVVADTVSKHYGQLSKDREFWPIPWFEYDGDQWFPQPNTKRFYNNARDALKKGAKGLLGIHWRTRDVEESHAYISQFAWDTSLKYEEFHRDYARKRYGDARTAKLLMDLQDLGYRWIGGGGQIECGGFTWTPVEDTATKRLLGTFQNTNCDVGSDGLDYLAATRDWATNYNRAAQLLSSSGEIRRLLDELAREGRKANWDQTEFLMGSLAEARDSLCRAMTAYSRRMSNRGELGVLATINAKAWADLRAVLEKTRTVAGVDVRAEVAGDRGPLGVSSILRSTTAFKGQPFRVSAVVHCASADARAAVVYRIDGRPEKRSALRFVNSGRLEGHIPSVFAKGGLLEYRVIVSDGQSTAKWPRDGMERVSVVPAPPGPNVLRPRAGLVPPQQTGQFAQVSGPLLVRMYWPDVPATRVFQVMRQDLAGNWKEVGRVRDTWFEDRTVLPGDRYVYEIRDADTGRVVANRQYVEPRVRMGASDPPLPPPPTVEVRPACGRVRLRWKANDLFVSGFHIYRSPFDAGPWEAIQPITSNTNAETVTAWCAAEPDKTFYYRVSALSLTGKEGPSSVAVAAVAGAVGAPPIISLDFESAPAGSTAQVTKANNVPVLRTGGGSYLELPHREAFDDLQELSVSFWVKLTESGVMPVFVCHGVWDTDGFFLQLLGGRIRFCLGGLATLDSGWLPIGKWAHVAATYDGAEMTTYLDGAAVESRPASGAIVPKARSLYIGRYDAEGHDWETNGYMAAVRIHDYALTPDDVKKQYDALAGKLAGH